MNAGAAAPVADDARPDSLAAPDENRERLAITPPLGILTALSALLSAGIKRLAIPALSGVASDELLFALSRQGRFFTNLAAVAGLVALSVALFGFIRDPLRAGLGRRLLVATFAGVFLPTMALAVFFPKEQTTSDMVLFGIGTANVLAVSVTMSSARAARRFLGRAVGVLCASAALFAFPAQVAPVLLGQPLELPHMQVLEAFRNAGELGYLLALMGLTLLVFPIAPGRRNLLARVISFATMLAAGWAFFTALSISSRYLAELLRVSQGVQWFIERGPALYALPLSLGISSSLGALVGSDRNRAQAGTGVLLLMSAGYAPCSPERLITFTLGMMLIARALVATGASETGGDR